VLIDAIVLGAPEAPAIVRADGGVTTYAELRAAIDTRASELGDVKGRAVAVACADPAAFLVGALAAWRAGAAVLPLDPRGGAWCERAASRVRVAAVIKDDGVEHRDGARDLDERVALVLFTSGSSAEPKAVLLGKAGIVANVRAILAYLPVAANPRTAIVVPLSYSYGLVGQALVTLAAGGAAILLGAVGYPALQVDAMSKLDARGLSSVPASLRLLARAAIELPPSERPRLSYVASAGAPLDGATIDLVRAAFPGARMFNQYGLTEASPRVTALDDSSPAFARGSVGRPLEGIDVWAASPDGARLPANAEGQLVVRGPSVMLGYLDDTDATTRALDASGALFTGDAGHVDGDGFVFVSGRLDGVVKCAGERVSVEEVAAALRAIEGVRDACVIAVPHAELGATLHAYVEGPKSIEASLRAAVRESLPPAKRPSRITIVDALPRTANGKIARHLLEVTP
jgi:long-chain acyl-CoA synthetase